MKEHRLQVFSAPEHGCLLTPDVKSVMVSVEDLCNPKQSLDQSNNSQEAILNVETLLFR